MIAANIKFAGGNTVCCVGGVHPDGSIKYWNDSNDIKAHIRYLNNKGYAVQLINIVGN